LPDEKPWFKNPTIVIPAVIVILAAIIGVSWDYWLRPPSPDFDISVNPPNGQGQQGSVTQTTVTVTGINGYKHPATLSASELPSGVLVNFVPPFGGGIPTYTSSLMININSNVPVGNHVIKINGIGADGKAHNTAYTLNVLPGPTSPSPSTSIPTSIPPIDVKIKSPTYGEIVPVSTIISGTSSGQLPNGQYMWVAINPEKTPGLWWPQGGRITPLNGQWDVQAWMGGDQDKGTKFNIIVISLDEEGDKYYLDYLAKGQKTGSYPGNPLPANVNILANISVTRQ
jgi:hypothetical protein